MIFDRPSDAKPGVGGVYGVNYDQNTINAAPARHRAHPRWPLLMAAALIILAIGLIIHG